MLTENKLAGVVNVNPGDDCKEAAQPVRNEIAVYTKECDGQAFVPEEAAAPENIVLLNPETGNLLDLPSLQSGVRKVAKDQAILDVPAPTVPLEAATKSGEGSERESVPSVLREDPDKTSGRAEHKPGPTGSEEMSLRIDSSTNDSGAHDGTATASIRMVRVSLLWLLLSGSIFISFIILLNTMTRPGEQLGEVSKEVRSTNSSTNQAPEKPVEAAVAPVEETRVEPMPAPTAQPVEESKVEATPTAPTVEPSPELQPQREQVAEPEVRKPAPVQASADTVGKFTIQVGSYNESRQAQQRLASLSSLGIDARVAQVEIPRRGTWYRVQVGRFSTRDEANRYAVELRTRRAAESTFVTAIGD